MKQVSENQIAEAIEGKCQKQLDRLAQAGLPHRALVTMLVLAAQGRLDLFPEETQEAFRDRGKAMKKFSEHTENLEQEARALQLEPLHVNDRAESAKKSSHAIGRYLRTHARKDHDRNIAILLDGILRYRKQFNCWEPLALVIAEAYLAAGIENTEHITAEMLYRVAKRARTKAVDGGTTQ
jgi:hypothetical protein